MSRKLFKAWGADLTPEDFSAALAGLAKFGPLNQILSDDLIETEAALTKNDASPHIVEASLTNIAEGIRLITNSGHLIPALDYLHLWRNFLKYLAPVEDIFIELNATLKEEFHSLALDVFWVLRELQRPGGAAGAAYLKSKHDELPVAFELPWRFGVLDDQESRRIAKVIRNNRWQHLFKVVSPEASNLQCDMLILPFDLPTARSRLLMLRKNRIHIEADSVIVMRGIGEPDTGQALELATAIQDSVKTSGLDIVSVPVERDSDWMNQLVLLLSHDTPLIDALPMAQETVFPGSPERDPVANLPIIFASRNLAQAARVRVFAKRLEKAVRSSGPQFTKEADILAKHITAGKWQSELGEATEIVSTRQQMELATGGIKIPRFGENITQATPPLAPALPVSPDLASIPEISFPSDVELVLDRASLALPSTESEAATIADCISGAVQPTQPDQRRVLIDLYDVTDPGNPNEVSDRLHTARKYEIQLFIAMSRQATVSATTPFPRNKLPPGDNVLNVHFVPLIRGENGEPLSSQHNTLLLPDTADSKACQFNFAVPQKIDTYRARFIISYHNRVLQTLILSAPVGNSKGEFVLDIENIVDPSFEGLSERPRFDAAIIINDSPGGIPAAITMKGNEAILANLENLIGLKEDLRKFILEKAAFPPPGKSYASKQIADLIVPLSQMGKNLWDELPINAKGLFNETTQYIQIVDAVSGAYFPAEFVYWGEYPDDDAKLCPHGEDALKSGSKACLENCNNKNDPQFVCPLGMWGFRMVIERQPATGEPQLGFIIKNMTETQKIGRANILENVVVSVSNKVNSASKKAIGELVTELGKVSKKVSFAKNWKELAATVNKESPTLLVLLPHNGVDETIPGKPPKLELGGEWLARGALKEAHIIGPKSDRPVVLLLGCDTNTAEIPFLNFIKRFKDCGATMVMGTITQIDALRTVDFVKRLASEIETSEKTKTFGELLLSSRRNMLAKGDGYALSLLAYGDSDQ